MIFGSVAASNAILCVIVPRQFSDTNVSFIVTVGFIFATLLFGGAIIPSATGVIVAAVRPELRQLSSAGSMFTFQMFGYALAPLVSAVVMSVWKINDFDRCDVDISSANLTEAGELLLAQGGYVNGLLEPGGTCWSLLNMTRNDTQSIGGVVDIKYDIENEKSKLSAGYTLCMFWSLFALFFMFRAWRAAVAAMKKEQAAGSGRSAGPSAGAGVGAGVGAGIGVGRREDQQFKQMETSSV